MQAQGGTLSLQYTLDALEDKSLRRPDRVLLVSPAIELTPVAMLAEIIDLFSVLPIPLLDKVRWQAVAPEFDPYKYNSFAVNASRQINRATRGLQRSLQDAQRAGRLAQLAPVVTWQSVVDSTVGSAGVVDQVYARLDAPAHRLVLFDLNRLPELAGVERPEAHALIERDRRECGSGLRLDARQGILGGLRQRVALLPGQLRVAQDSGQRSAQFMAGIGEELLGVAIGLGHLGQR